MTTNERELNRHKAKIAKWLKEKREDTGFNQVSWLRRKCGHHGTRSTRLSKRK